MVTTCEFTSNGEGVWKCTRCGRVVRSQTGSILANCSGEWSPQARPCGPGCQLKRTLEWWRIRDDGSCGCDAFAAQMDEWGPDGCEAREDEILGHLAEAAVRRGLLFVPPAARLLIRRAISAAREEVAHGEAAVQKGADAGGSR